jgi:hypothetical protein
MMQEDKSFEKQAIPASGGHSEAFTSSVDAAKSVILAFLRAHGGFASWDEIKSLCVTVPEEYDNRVTRPFDLDTLMLAHTALHKAGKIFLSSKPGVWYVVPDFEETVTRCD